MKKLLPALVMLALTISSCSDFKKGFDEEMAKDEAKTDSLQNDVDGDSVQADTIKAE